jgi:peptide/nickel transport system substrate-binding protein
MVRRILILGLIAILGILATPPSGGAQSRGKTLNYILAQEPISMDPHVITETQSGLPVRHVYDRMVEVTPDGRQVVPGLAERWEMLFDHGSVKMEYWEPGKPALWFDFGKS